MDSRLLWGTVEMLILEVVSHAPTYGYEIAQTVCGRSRGYFEDPGANAQLFTPDGWMLMGDLVTIDEEGYLTIVGRTSDFIIRGGKNISAPAVEEEVSTMPGLIRCAFCRLRRRVSI